MTNPPHDALFKAIFGQPEHAAAELQHILPGHIAARIDWSTLTLQPGSYVDDELAEQHSDLLFSAAARPSREPTAEAVTMTIADQLHAEGHAQGRTQGKAEGKAEGKADSVLVLLRARGLHVPTGVQQRIETCGDAETLDRWLVRAATVSDPADVFET